MARQKTEATERVTTDEGNLLSQNRFIQVEGAFGVLKQNRDFIRFLTRGKQKTETQSFCLRLHLSSRNCGSEHLTGV